MAINGNVYDVSSYINEHPGGRKSIISRCGREVTGIFSRIHSNRAWDLLKNYKIGVFGDNINPTEVILSALFDSLQKANPDAEVINIKPQSKDLYLAKVFYKGTYYELHIDGTGKVIKEEKDFEEKDWNTWQNDVDDSGGKK